MATSVSESHVNSVGSTFVLPNRIDLGLVAAFTETLAIHLKRPR